MNILEQTEITIDSEPCSIDTLIYELESINKTTLPTITIPAATNIIIPEIDLNEKQALANRIVENSLDVIKNANMVFSSFSDDVIHGKDRSTSSKETLIKALEVQNQANKNLIDLARSLEGSKEGNTNILIASSISSKKSGINTDNIKNHFLNG